MGWRNPKSAAGLLSFMSSLRRRGFDLVIDLQGLFRSGWLAWQTRAPVRVGLASAREGASFFYTHCVEVGTPNQHAIDRYLKVTAALGCDPQPIEFPFHATEEDRKHVDGLLENDEPFAVLLPGTNWQTKRWPVENFAALVPPLAERFGLRSVVAGSGGDSELAKSIGGIDVTGKTNLRQLVALLERAQIVIANDSGPMHIAAALGRPLVTLFGPTNPIRTGPYRRNETVLRLDMPCSPCYSRTCCHQSCLQWLKVEAVLEEVENQIGVFAAQERT
jgi:lipopolysaccharide heptosyltransferase II